MSFKVSIVLGAFALIAVCNAFTLLEDFNDEALVPVYVAYLVPSGNVREWTRFNSDVEIASRHKRSPQFKVGAGAEHNRRGGTDVNVNAGGRVWQSQNGRTTVDANANWNRHYGGQQGTGRSNTGVGVEVQHRFGN